MVRLVAGRPQPGVPFSRRSERWRARWQSAGVNVPGFNFEGTNVLAFSPDGSTLWSNSTGAFFPNASDATGVRAWQVPSGRE